MTFRFEQVIEFLSARCAQDNRMHDMHAPDHFIARERQPLRQRAPWRCGIPRFLFSAPLIAALARPLQGQGPLSDDSTHSLEDLMGAKGARFSKKADTDPRTSTAQSVITQNEIKRSLCRTVAMTILVSLLSSFLTGRAYPQTRQAGEYQVKAEVLFDIAKFVDWPDGSLGSPQDSFTICVIGQDPFGDALDKTFAGKTISDRTVAVDRFPFVSNLAASRRCQIAFISSSEKNHWRDVIGAFRGTSVLLVGDSDGFAASGGAIEFLLDDGHVRFAINPEAADRANLKVSSKLLSLAKIVHDDAAKGKG
jgi:hypothetical protein